MTAITDYWQQFKLQEQLQSDNYEAWSFGYYPQTIDELAQLVLQGQKTATTSGFTLYEHDGDALPLVGDYNIILDSQNQPVCITQTLVVEKVPFQQVTAEHAYLEGEGDRSLDYWRRVHWDFFQKEYQTAGLEFTPESLCVCELFKCVYQ
ncbi:ASCH domain-containing protein [Lactobacillus sp. DCY120]|uniref:ASCH domain-containing protein n=1 Tax=Bombilactobacillus apium TaxID=2675299 RepID=A0A850R8Y8_9LACO|nr:ASCH domain-containing protein [Bombilactobacillus apium]NVY95866.1 ASCH domain-containing protein [Bombilactobacillus apium]